MRRALLALTLLLVVVLGPAGAAMATPTKRAAPPTTIGGPNSNGSNSTAQTLPSGCVGNSLPSPDCGVKPQHPGDRGGAAQTALFFLVLGGMAVIFFVVIRSTRARGRAQSA